MQILSKKSRNPELLNTYKSFHVYKKHVYSRCNLNFTCIFKVES